MGRKGGSQLSQLKSKLHSSGITDRRQQSRSSKKRKSGASRAGLDQRAEAEERRRKLAAIASSSAFNPFEEKISKPKHEVLGRRVRGSVGRPGAAKASGLAQRRATLLPQYEGRDRSGAFLDRRFGEGDASLTPEDKMLERFTRERQRGSAASGGLGQSGSSSSRRAALFSLEDGPGEGLTHYGRSLNELDDLEDVRLSDDEGLEETAQASHFGGFGDGDGEDEDDGGEGRTKTKAEVMAELVAKAKQAKSDRQQVKERDEALRRRLDDELGDIRGLLNAAAPPAPPPTTEGDAVAAVASKDEKEKEKDQYDAFVRELAFERRAQPQDRLKTEEEAAQELAERLRVAEEARLRRMRGLDDDDDDEDGDGRGKARRGKRKRPAGGDDLEDDFDLDGQTAADAYGLGLGLGLRAGEQGDESDGAEEDEEEDEEGEEEEGDEEEEEEHDDFGDMADLEAMAQPGEDIELAEEKATQKKKAGSPKKTGKDKDLPFTFACPTSHEALLATLARSGATTAAELHTVVKRIRALHHASLDRDNKLRLQALLGVLLDHALYCAGDGHFEHVNALVPHIYALSKTYATTGAEHFVGKLALMQRNLGRGLARGALTPGAKTWPGAAELTLLRIAGLVWSTSDRWHAVCTPMALLVGQYLASSRLRSRRDAASALFLCSLVASHEGESRRLVPEALNCLHQLLLALLPTGALRPSVVRRTNEAFGVPAPDSGLRLGGGDIAIHGADGGDDGARDGADADITAPLSFTDALCCAAEDSSIDARALLATTYALIDEFARLYAGSPAFVELFEPFRRLLVDAYRADPRGGGGSGSSGSALDARRAALVDGLTRALRSAAASRRALRLQAHRARSITQAVPKFDQQGYDPLRRGGRPFDPDAERAEAQKLRALLKKERKGAVRELRRDGQFLAAERARRHDDEARDYKRKMDRILGGLTQERGEEKSYLREKQRLKRRAASSK